MRILRTRRQRETRDILVGQDVLGDENRCWACSSKPVTIKGKTCAAPGCEQPATNALGYYWNPFTGLGGRNIQYLCSDHGIEIAKKLYDHDGNIALLP